MAGGGVVFSISFKHFWAPAFLYCMGINISKGQ